MAKFRVKLTNNDYAKNYCFKLKNLLSSEDVIANPFKGNVLLSETKDYLFVDVELVPIYPPVYWLFFLFATIGFFFNGFNLSWVVFVFLFLGFFSLLFWSNFFYMLVFRKGLRNQGYKDSIIFE